MGQDGEPLAAALSAAVDALLAAPIARYPRDELLALLRDVDSQLRRLAAVDAQLIGEVDQRHTAAELGAANTAVLLGQLLRIAPGEAAARLRAARDLAPRRGLTGEALPAIFPAVGAALAAGELNPAHARLIGTTIDAIPAEAEQAALGRGEHLAQQVEATLVAQAGRLDPRQLGHVATRLLAHLDPDGAAPRDDELQRRRRLELHTRADGTGLLHGELSPETAAVWRTVLDALSRPAPQSDNLPDPRSGGQRRHDALLDAGQRLLRAGDLPDAGGTPVTLLITLTDQQLATATGSRSPNTVNCSPRPPRSGSPTKQRSPPACSPPPAASTTTAAPAGWPPRRCAGRWPPATTAAPSPAAPSHPPGAKPIT